VEKGKTYREEDVAIRQDMWNSRLTREGQKKQRFRKEKKRHTRGGGRGWNAKRGKYLRLEKMKKLLDAV